jgi:hypothetical protein
MNYYVLLSLVIAGCLLGNALTFFVYVGCKKFAQSMQDTSMAMELDLDAAPPVAGVACGADGCGYTVPWVFEDKDRQKAALRNARSMREYRTYEGSDLH